MRYFIRLSYKGTKFRGWQTQFVVKTVQETLENTFAKMTGRHQHIHGCGRTDAQVHASNYIAHVDVPIPFDYDPVFRLNKMLPPDIRIHDIFKVDDQHNAQLSAVARTYKYEIHGDENPLIYETSWHYPNLSKLNFKEMKLALKFLEEHEEYYSLCRRPNSYPHTKCQVFDTKLTFNEEYTTAVVIIKANRFLKSMIRVMINRLIEIGNGQLTLEEFKENLIHKKPFEPLTLAPPQGLHLIKVEYPFLSSKKS